LFVIFSDSALAALHAMRVESSTRAMFNSLFKHWSEFVDQRETIAEDYLMEGCAKDVKTQFSCIVAVYCCEKHYSVISSFSALRDTEKLLNLKKDLSRNIYSSFFLGVHKQAPITYEIIRDLRNWYFIPDQAVNLTNCQIYLGAADQYCFGLRASKICWKGPTKDR